MIGARRLMNARRALRSSAIVIGALMVAGIVTPAPAFAEARCDATTTSHLHALADAPAAADAIDSTCRRWPFNPDVLLAAAAFPVDSDAPERALRTVVAMLDAESGRVLARHVHDVHEDAGFALERGSLALDTARYDIRAGERAFGLVVRNASRNPSCPEGGADPVMTLFVRDGEQLRPVFAQPLVLWTLVDGEVCSPVSVTEQARIKIAVAPTLHAGFADLTLVATMTRYRRNPDGVRDEALGTRRWQARYDGDTYRASPPTPFFPSDDRTP